MRIWAKWLVGIAVAVGGLASLVRAADALPAVGVGASREAVFQAYGWPTGQSWFGSREILNYPQGFVTLESGRVERVNFSTRVPWPAPRPQPAAPSPVSAKKSGAVIDPWNDDFEIAARAASDRGQPILALFSGPDGSPASRQFHEQGALHPDWRNELSAHVVFLRLDFSPRALLAASQREQNEWLRSKHGVTVYPTLLLLSPTGAALAAIDLGTPNVGEAFRARVIAAIKAQCAQLTEVAAGAASAEAASAAEALPAGAGWVQKLLARNLGLHLADAFTVVVVAAVLAVGTLLVWLLWRTRTPEHLPRAAMAVRLSESAGGVPTSTEIAAWPKEKICAVTAALAESEGYVAEVMPFGSDKDLLLMNRGESHPRVVVFCAAGNSGVVPAKRLRELRGTLTAEGVQSGWFVSPKGFANDALSYAAEHHLNLIDASRMIERLSELPPLLLPKVLPRAAVREAA